MRWTRLSIIAVASFLVTTGGAVFKKSIALSLCSILTFNSLTCQANFGDASRVNAAAPPNSNEVEQSLSDVPEGQEVADICLFGACVPVDLPGPIDDVIEGGLNNAVKREMRSLLADEIPISGSEHEFYKNVANLPGGAFTPQLLPLNSLSPDTPIPPGDYEIPAHFYCTKIYSFDGRGNRFPLARLDGRMSDVLSALYARASYDSSVSINDVQTLSWAIQSGMSYGELPDSQRALIDRLIPEYRDRMEKSFVDKLTGIVDNVSRISGNRLPGVNQILNDLGPVGDVASTLLRAREQVLRTNYGYQALAQEFAPQKDVFLDGGTEETPWSQVRENVYMRFIAPDGALDDGTVQVRIVGNSSSQLDPEHPSIMVASLSPYEGIASNTTSDVTAENLTQDITQSVGVPEASGSQAITASLPPAKSDGKCDLKVVLFLGFDGVSSGSSDEDREYRVAPVDGMGALQRRLQEEMSKYPTVSLSSQVYRWDGENAALADIESAIKSKRADSIVIIGHSYGADSANSLADTLNSKGIRVDMLIQVDTVGVWDDIFPSNVSTLINYYQTNDKTILVEDNIPGAENINATERFDKTLIHTTIDDNKALHQDIVTRILEKTRFCRERENSAN
ncbi:MAG: hypothetical protein LDL41_21780 [Coleofasciculus sp. S288]|nr:hypothetical protein [Coleofasciculus sp. S288]